MILLLLPAAFALAGGVAVALQGPLTSMMSQRVGTLESVFIVHLGGAGLGLLGMVAAILMPRLARGEPA